MMKCQSGGLLKSRKDPSAGASTALRRPGRTSKDSPMSDTHTFSSDVAFTPAVKAVQARKGSRSAYARVEQHGGWRTEIDADLTAFLAEQNSMFLATASADGQPYIQHRGGPKGFIRILDKGTLAFADYSGNRQYITQGNLSENPKANIFLMDYAHRRRVKIWGEARVVDDDPALLKSLMPQGYKARPEQVILFRISAWDTNCPQHIPQKFDAADVAAALAVRDARIAELEAELATLEEKASATVGEASGRLSQRYPGEVRVKLKHRPVDMGCKILEFFGSLPQLRGEERRENPGQGTECGGIGPARRFTHQIRLVAKLNRQRKQRAGCQVDVLVGSVAAETAQQVVLGDAELRVLAKFFAQMLGRAIEEMRRPFGKVFSIYPPRADQRPINMVLDHPLERPGLRALLQIKRRVEIETVFAFNMRANEGGIGDALALIEDIGQLPLGRGRRYRPLLAIGKTGHLQLDFGGRKSTR